MQDVDLLFVCLGNICRSPLAEGIMRHLSRSSDVSLRIASAGTGRWHVGEAPHVGSQKIAQKFGIDITKQRARHISQFNVMTIPYVCVMDQNNYQDVIAYRPQIIEKAIPLLMMRFFEQSSSDHAFRSRPPHDFQALSHVAGVPDPYYGNGAQAFQEVFTIIHQSCEGLLSYIDHIRA